MEKVGDCIDGSWVFVGLVLVVEGGVESPEGGKECRFRSWALRFDCACGGGGGR